MMRSRRFIARFLFVVLIFTGGFFTGCNKVEEPAAKAADVDCAVLLESRCQACHYLTRICQALGKKSQQNWQRTIKTMVKRGARLNTDEQKVVAACLDQQTGEVQNLCRSDREE